MVYDCASQPRGEGMKTICEECGKLLRDAGYSVMNRSRDGMGNCEICLRRTLVHEAEVRKESRE